MTKHSPFGPSASHRWIACPGSINAEQDAVDAGILIRVNRHSQHTAEGTAAHELAEDALNGKDVSAYIGTVIEVDGEHAIEITKEMVDYIQVYVDFVRTFDGDLRVEQRVKFTDWVPDGFGTSDAVILQKDRLVVVDLKYGKGVPVHAENNTQAILYALGAFQGLTAAQKKKVKTVLMCIVQPRLDSISEWEISITDLLKHGERISAAAQDALLPDAPMNPGEEQCRWCSIKAFCPALKSYTEAAILEQFENLDELTPVNRLTDEQLRRALESAPLIKSWLDAVANHVQEKLENGEGFPGFKLVEGRSLRQWENEDEAVDVLEMLLGDDAYTKKPLSPTQAEKALGKKLKAEIQYLITKPSGKPTMVPESDKRPAINITSSDFEVL